MLHNLHVTSKVSAEGKKHGGSHFGYFMGQCERGTNHFCSWPVGYSAALLPTQVAAVRKMGKTAKRLPVKHREQAEQWHWASNLRRAWNTIFQLFGEKFQVADWIKMRGENCTLPGPWHVSLSTEVLNQKKLPRKQMLQVRKVYYVSLIPVK